jgi:glycine betaine/proline transport system substrate-binding protein
MLTELTAATKAGENIVVTLWQPHWAYSALPIKTLEDPKGALAATESLHTFAKADFADDYPQAATWLKGFKMDLDQLQSLEDAMFVKYEGHDYGPVVKKWIAEKQDYVDSLTSK